MIRSITIALAIILLGLRPAIAGGGIKDKNVVHQLRIYEIFDDNKYAFHDRFKHHAARIMAKHGFRIVAMWESKTESRTEFVYLIEWQDRATMTQRWREFMVDQEWADIKKRTAAEHGALLGDIQDRVLETTEYSPTKSFFSQGNE